MKIEPIPLFASFQSFFIFFIAVTVIFFLSLGEEYRDYRRLTRFNDAVLPATVIGQYEKIKGDQHYRVLKLRSSNGAPFFMTASDALHDLRGYEVTVRLKTEGLTFMAYLGGFFARGYIETVSPLQAGNYRLAERISAQHSNGRIGSLFSALFAATPIASELREKIGALGIGHLLAISGFHIGLLSLLIFGVLKHPYRWMQSKWFPWRNAKRDLFIVGLALLGAYALFLQLPPSVMRAYGMMLIGFVFYDRGVKVLSFQSLMITVLLLIALWPRLLFSVGFWLSASGVFYIFAFLQRYADKGKLFTLVGIHLWVYVMMLPIALALFGSFTLLHPLSVLWTMGFILFYPLALFLHLIGMGGLLDGTVQELFRLAPPPEALEYGGVFLALWIGLSLLAPVSKTVERLLPYLAAAVLIGAVYQVT